MPSADTSRTRRVFGGQVRRLRKDRGWTQADLAEKAGISLDMVGRIERGTASPSFETIVSLATRLEVSASVLFGGQLGKGRMGDRTKRIDAILASLVGLEVKELDRVHRLILAAIK